MAKINKIKDEFLQRINSVVKKHDIPPELIYNWDHTGINYVPVSSWTMEVEGTQRVPIIGLDDKRQVTVVFAGTLSGDFLAPQVIYQGKTSACHPEYDFPLAWNITHSPNHWANTDTQMEYTSRVLVPHMDKTKKKLGLPNTQKSLCIFDVFRAQMSREFVDDLKKTKNIEIVYIPPSTTDKLQPMDLECPTDMSHSISH
ncbi:uncharacterized protein LOC133204236 [Saccostrea echinata]|uniref:uncharacterized protein LOC133204236 n=1 Tax=Saccostrea echinata TaxID=191078 RepID=UPI002A7F907E|nr:uncharacterized protein LOC133204236 [Saccostrea echinata]